MSSTVPAAAPAVRKGGTKLKGNPVDVRGPQLKAGDAAPAVEVVDTSLQPVRIGGPSDKVRLILAVPSLDTAVCDAQTRRFNQEAAGLGHVEIDVVSTDLPMAIKRWCGAAGVDRVKALSDHRSTAFGDAYGTTIVSGPLTRFLSRAVFVVDKAGKVRYAEYVPEIGSHPDYDKALAAAKAVL